MPEERKFRVIEFAGSIAPSFVSAVSRTKNSLASIPRGLSGLSPEIRKGEQALSSLREQQGELNDRIKAERTLRQTMPKGSADYAAQGKLIDRLSMRRKVLNARVAQSALAHRKASAAIAPNIAMLTRVSAATAAVGVGAQIMATQVSNAASKWQEWNKIASTTNTTVGELVGSKVFSRGMGLAEDSARGVAEQLADIVTQTKLISLGRGTLLPKAPELSIAGVSVFDFKDKTPAEIMAELRKDVLSAEDMQLTLSVISSNLGADVAFAVAQATKLTDEQFAHEQAMAAATAKMREKQAEDYDDVAKAQGGLSESLETLKGHILGWSAEPMVNALDRVNRGIEFVNEKVSENPVRAQRGWREGIKLAIPGSGPIIDMLTAPPPEEEVRSVEQAPGRIEREVVRERMEERRAASQETPIVEQAVVRTDTQEAPAFMYPGTTPTAEQPSVLKPIILPATEQPEGIAPVPVQILPSGEQPIVHMGQVERREIISDIRTERETERLASPIMEPIVNTSVTPEVVSESTTIQSPQAPVILQQDMPLGLRTESISDRVTERERVIERTERTQAIGARHETNIYIYGATDPDAVAREVGTKLREEREQEAWAR